MSSSSKQTLFSRRQQDAYDHSNRQRLRQIQANIASSTARKRVRDDDFVPADNDLPPVDHNQPQKRHRNVPDLLQRGEEADEWVIARRLKQIGYGMNTRGYLNYVKLVPRAQRKLGEPQTPPRTEKMSKRMWDGLYKVWRRDLHRYETPECEQAVAAIEERENNKNRKSKKKEKIAQAPSSDEEAEEIDLAMLAGEMEETEAAAAAAAAAASTAQAQSREEAAAVAAAAAVGIDDDAEMDALLADIDGLVDDPMFEGENGDDDDIDEHLVDLDEFDI